MYILTFILVFALSQFVTNKLLKVSDENSISYTYSRRDGLIIFGFIVIGILLQVFVKFTGKTFWIILAIYAFLILMTMIVLATMKKVIVEKQKEDMKKVFDVLAPALPKNAEFDMNTLPFRLSYDGTKINRITMDIINPTTFKEDLAINICLSLNKYLPDYEWVPEFDYASRECSFVGTPLPPHVAKYPGSWLRPSELIPIGLTGLGEIGWVINSYKNEGRSLYVYADGKRAKTVDSPSAPQALTVGGPLGLDTIIPTVNGYKTMETIEVGDIVFGLDNVLSKVMQVHEIHISNEVYELQFTNASTNIKVISDDIHRFPVITRARINKQDADFFKPVLGKDLEVGMYIVGGTEDFILERKTKIAPQKVRCITVNNDQHIFKIAISKDPTWVGGTEYNNTSLLVYNTGGGKAIYVEQEIDTE